jgi:hypothetical protein
VLLVPLVLLAQMVAQAQLVLQDYPVIDIKQQAQTHYQ